MVDLRTAIQKRAAEVARGTIQWLGVAYAFGVDHFGRDVAGVPATALFRVSPEDEALFPKYCRFRNGEVYEQFATNNATGSSNETAVKRVRKIIEVARANGLSFERIFDIAAHQYETPEALLEALDRPRVTGD